MSKNILSNAFSLSMLDIDAFAVLQVKRVEIEDVPSDVVSVVGHPDTARVIAGILGHDVPCNRRSIKLEPKDTLYVAQYIGPRLPEGATELPEGAKMEFFRVIVKPEGCLGCRKQECSGCAIWGMLQGQ